MKRVLLTTPPKETLIDPDGVGGHWYDRTDTYMAWTCALEEENRLSTTCPPIGLRFLKENVPDIDVLEYPTWQEYIDALDIEPWDMVGISFYTWSTPVAVEMAQKARDRGVKEIWGGNYGAMEPGLNASFTRLVKGPGEYVLHEYVYDRPLPQLRHPPLLGKSSFRGLSSGVGYLYSKRGCNIGCTFCSTPLFNPHEDPISMEALNAVLDTYRDEKVAHVIIYDETFFLDSAPSERVVDALAERDLQWICLTRADRIRGRIGELTDRCMDGAIIGVESFRNANLADIHKREDALNMRRTIQELNEYGRRALGTFMIGFERDSAKEIEWDIQQLAEENLFACQLTVLTPFYGTKLYKQMKHLINEPDLSRFDLYHLVWQHPKIEAEEMRDLLAWAQRTVNDPDRISDKIKEGIKQKMRKSLMSRKSPTIYDNPSQGH